MAYQLNDFKRPQSDNGKGIHTWLNMLTGNDLAFWLWRVTGLGCKWVTTLQTDLAFMQACANLGIQPCSRPFYRASREWAEDDSIVEHMLQAGLGPYVQIYNEPELACEWEGQGAGDETWRRRTWINRWIAAATYISNRGGYPGIQCLDPDWLRELLQEIKARGLLAILEKAWFCSHNYAGNHPPSYPYDALNPGKTIMDDWFCMLNPLKFEQVFLEEIGRYVPCIAGEGGWCIGNSDDNRYPKTDYAQHRDYHLAMFDMFRTGIMPNGEYLPDWWFAVTPWLLTNLQAGGGDMSFEENAWYSNTLSGTKTLTIEAVTAMPPFVRQFTGDTPDPQPEPEEPTTMTLAEQYPDVFAAWVAAGGEAESSFRLYLQATGRLDVTTVDLARAVGQVQAHVGELAAIATRLPKV